MKKRPKYSLHAGRTNSPNRSNQMIATSIYAEVDPEVSRPEHVRPCFAVAGGPTEQRGDPGTEKGERYAGPNAFIRNNAGLLRFANPHLHRNAHNRFNVHADTTQYRQSDTYILRLINVYGRSRAAHWFPDATDWPAWYGVSGTADAPALPEAQTSTPSQDQPAITGADSATDGTDPNAAK